MASRHLAQVLRSGAFHLAFLRTAPNHTAYAMGTAAKLTKKQKKALAFRERQTKSKGKSKATDADVEEEEEEEENGVPVMEDQDRAEGEVEDRRVESEAGRAGAAAGARGELGKGGKKRKRGGEPEVEGEEEGRVQATKRRKGGDGVVDGVQPKEDAGQDSELKAKKGVKQQRFILFVGMSARCRCAVGPFTNIWARQP